MGGSSDESRPQLHEVTPRELTGRDVIARFQAQFRAAALACLQVLEGKDLDRIYCDYQDDFVARESSGGAKNYHFFQVKTKKSKKHQWTRLELFGLIKRFPKVEVDCYAPGGPAPKPATVEQLTKLKESFVGKLLDHTARFEDSCKSVTFLTNVYLSDEVEEIGAAISSGNIGERTVRFLADHYVATLGITTSLPMGQVHARIGKLALSAGHDYLDPHHQDFESKAVKAVWEYSEIDLTHTEGVELVEKLLALVQKKSCKTLISDLTAADLDTAAGIGVEDLLDLLPISRGAYQQFLTQGDASALKNASILQRKLGQAGASAEVIEAASRWKVAWDNWFRTNRHTYEREVIFLQHKLNGIYGRLARGEVSFAGLNDEVEKLMHDLDAGSIKSLLTEELLVGGIMSELVRSESR